VTATRQVRWEGAEEATFPPFERPIRSDLPAPLPRRANARPRRAKRLPLRGGDHPVTGVLEARQKDRFSFSSTFRSRLVGAAEIGSWPLNET